MGQGSFVGEHPGEGQLLQSAGAQGKELELQVVAAAAVVVVVVVVVAVVVVLAVVPVVVVPDSLEGVVDKRMQVQV